MIRSLDPIAGRSLCQRIIAHPEVVAAIGGDQQGFVEDFFVPNQPGGEDDSHCEDDDTCMKNEFTPLFFKRKKEPDQD